MSLKQETGRRLRALISRMDEFNRSLAERALPNSRRRKVSELSLEDKALKAGQRAVKKTVKERSTNS
jgi:hypothetical protein